jgi:curli production assembly/transport component CsgF
MTHHTIPTCGVIAAAVLAAVIAVAPATASSLVYQPTNPNFGGSPLNGSYLATQGQLQNAEIQRKQSLKSQATTASGSAATQTPGQIFARQLQSQLYGSLANKITQSIFGEGAQQSGTFSFEGTTISFVRVGTNVQLTINDGQSVTTITVPAGI